MQHKKVEIKLLLETSWEVCNKVGGIYTVLSTKAKVLQTLFKDKVIFIGPDVWSEQTPCPVFKESKTLLRAWVKSSNLPEGVKVRVGRWEIPGRPVAVLVDFKSMFAHNNALYGAMWQRFGVDSLHAYGDYGEAAAFSHAAGIVIESLARHYNPDCSEGVIAHFDEWTTGMGLLYVKANAPQVATVFTTHATSIGRSICGNGKELYRYFSGYNGDQMAGELNMEAKHSLEKAAAINADCFTTVSDITAEECAQLLGKSPDVVTPNGFEDNFVPAPRQFKTRRAEARQAMLEVASRLTGARFDDNATFIVATSGRCEYRNKGLDVFIDAVSQLGCTNRENKVLAFVMVPAWVKEPRTDLLPDHSRCYPLPDPFMTHWVNNPDQDPVVGHIRHSGLNNEPDDNTFIIYVPCYLDGKDGIFGKSYYNLLIGMDATVFPSYYEPWGYTPLESVAFGVPTVTTSLSGFGRWVLANFTDNLETIGVSVTRRDDGNYHQVCTDIAHTLGKLIDAPAEERKRISDGARNTSHAAAWDYFIDYYLEAYDMAVHNAAIRNR